MIVSGGRATGQGTRVNVASPSTSKPDVVIPKTIKSPVVPAQKETVNTGIVQRGINFLRGLFK